MMMDDFFNDGEGTKKCDAQAADRSNDVVQ